MWKLLLFLILSVQLGNAQDSIVRDYFFDQNLTVDSTTSLVLLVRNPQTEFAKNLGHRIYTDSNQINELKRTFYKNIENGVYSVHKCGYDLFFYLYKNDTLHYLKALNSNCSIGDFECENFDALKENGESLRTEVLWEIPDDFKANKDRYFSNLLTSYYFSESPSEKLNNALYPIMYYEHYFTVTFDLDTTISPKKNIENYLAKYTSNYAGVQWYFKYNNYYTLDGKFDPRKMKDGRCSAEFSVYFKESRLKDFSGETIYPVLPHIELGYPLTLIYKPSE